MEKKKRVGLGLDGSFIVTEGREKKERERRRGICKFVLADTSCG